MKFCRFEGGGSWSVFLRDFEGGGGGSWSVFLRDFEGGGVVDVVS